MLSIYEMNIYLSTYMSICLYFIYNMTIDVSIYYQYLGWFVDQAGSVTTQLVTESQGMVR